MGQINLGRVVGVNGASVFIKYNTHASDVGATDTWSSGKNYIGVLTSTATTKPATGYTWSLFINDQPYMASFNFPATVSSSYWILGNYPLGAYRLAIPIPDGKLIVSVFNATKNRYTTSYDGTFIYSNAPFSGTAKFG